MFTLSGRTLVIRNVDEDEKYRAEREQSKNFKGNVKKLRNAAIEYRRAHKVELYYDLHTVDFDNGYYQFKNDIKHNDGVERYYIYSREYKNIDELFTKDEQAYLVKFGSEKHKLLYRRRAKCPMPICSISKLSISSTECSTPHCARRTRSNAAARIKSLFPLRLKSRTI